MAAHTTERELRVSQGCGVDVLRFGCFNQCFRSATEFDAEEFVLRPLPRLPTAELAQVHELLRVGFDDDKILERDPAQYRLAILKLLSHYFGSVAIRPAANRQPPEEQTGEKQAREHGSSASLCGVSIHNVDVVKCVRSIESSLLQRRKEIPAHLVRHSPFVAVLPSRSKITAIGWSRVEPTGAMLAEGERIETAAAGAPERSRRLFYQHSIVYVMHEPMQDVPPFYAGRSG